MEVGSLDIMIVVAVVAMTMRMAALVKDFGEALVHRESDDSNDDCFVEMDLLR